jgi:hypothetical protein
VESILAILHLDSILGLEVVIPRLRILILAKFIDQRLSVIPKIAQCFFLAILYIFKQIK